MWHDRDTSLLTVGETKQSSGFQNICQRKSSFITNSFLFLFSALSNCKTKTERPVSYGQWWFHRVSWASRPRTATCWCTCGNGRCLSTCSRTPCAAQISTPPSPPAFYFGSGKEKRQTTSTRETDEKGSTIHHSMRNRFPLFVSSDGVRQRRREMDTGPLSDHSPFSCCHTDSWTLLGLSKCLRGKQGAFNLWCIATDTWATTVQSWRSTKGFGCVKIMDKYKTNMQEHEKYIMCSMSFIVRVNKQFHSHYYSVIRCAANAQTVRHSQWRAENLSGVVRTDAKM